MSWLVAPKCTSAAADVRHLLADRRATSGTTGLPESAAARARSPTSYAEGSAQACSIATTEAAGMAPAEPAARANATSTSSRAATQAAPATRPLTGPRANVPPNTLSLTVGSPLPELRLRRT